MSYIQYVFHFHDSNSIDVRLLHEEKQKKILDWCIEQHQIGNNIGYNNTKYYQISKDSFKQDYESIEKMFKLHFPEYLI